MVTGHSGCRHQDWHIDGDRGLTLIFAMEDVTLKKGPTQIDFGVPFTAIDPNAQKVKGANLECERVFAAMPKGSLLMFNCNVSHRGTANLSSVDRPVLVLDTSAPCPHFGGDNCGQSMMAAGAGM